MMHHEAGVRTVAVGGRPSYGPMQAPSGSRGAQYYSTTNLDLDFQVATKINTTASDHLPRREEDVWITSASINLRDQVRKGEDVPLQFVYEAANCRIFYTLKTFNNFANLWRYAANAIWTNPELCVKDSTGYATKETHTDTQGPPGGSTSINTRVSHNMSGIIQLSGTSYDFPAAFSGQELDEMVQNSAGPQLTEGAICSVHNKDKTLPACSAPNYACRAVQNRNSGQKEQQCVRNCLAYLTSNSLSAPFYVGDNCMCQFIAVRTVSGTKRGQFLQTGYCVPSKDRFIAPTRAGLTTPAGPP